MWAWIGANDRNMEGKFVWANNNEALSFTNWAPNQPNNETGEKDCVDINQSNSNWVVSSCNDNDAFFCEQW